MADYMTRYKGKYRLLAEIDNSTNDFPRDSDGGISDSVGVYITCSNGNKIYSYGKNSSNRMQLGAYIPSLTRGRNIKKELTKLKIPFDNYDESSCEVMFTFPATEIDTVAKLLKAKVSGASISPFSNKNLPKSNAKLPDEEVQKYKDMTSKLHDGDWLIIKDINKKFMDEVLAKKLREKGKRKPFDYRSDQKAMMLTKDTKMYIYAKGLYEDYLNYLDTAIDDYYNSKQQ